MKRTQKNYVSQLLYFYYYYYYFGKTTIVLSTIACVDPQPVDIYFYELLADMYWQV